MQDECSEYDNLLLQNKIQSGTGCRLQNLLILQKKDIKMRALEKRVELQYLKQLSKSQTHSSRMSTTKKCLLIQKILNRPIKNICKILSAKLLEIQNVKYPKHKSVFIRNQMPLNTSPQYKACKVTRPQTLQAADVQTSSGKTEEYKFSLCAQPIF